MEIKRTILSAFGNISFNKTISVSLLRLPFLAIVSWAVIVCLMIIELVIYSYSQKSPYYWIFLYTSVLSLTGCILWSYSWRHWRKVLITATAVYLILVLMKFYRSTLFWSEKPFWEEIGYVFYTQWLLIKYSFSKGWVVQATVIAFFEWFMPALQTMFLVKYISLSNYKNNVAMRGLNGY